VNNFVGDAINLYKTDPTAFTKVPRALWFMAKPEKHMTPEEKALAKLVREQRVDVTYILSEAGVAPEFGAIARFTNPAVRYNPWNIWTHFWETVSVNRERPLRLAKFFKDLERIHRGEMVKAGEIDIEGLEPVDAAGKVARESLVDYGKTSPHYRRFIRGLLFPFATFYDQSARNWYRYAAKFPLKTFAKVGVPLAAMWTWNNTGERRKVEENLPDWWLFVPHIITGHKDKDDKPTVIAFQTPIDMAAKWFGLERIPAKITKIRAGDMTIKEAAMQQLKDTGLGFPRTLGALVNPAIQMIYGLATNRHPFYNTPIVPERFKGTSEALGFQARYVLSTMIAPYGAYMRATRMLEPGDVMGKWLMRGPFDIERALGIRHIDVDRGMENRIYGEEERLTGEVKQLLADMELAYNKWQVKGDKSDWEKVVEKYNQVTTKPTAEQIANRLWGWRNLERIAQDKLRRMKVDDPDVEEIKKLLEYIHKNRWLLHQQKVPKAIRPELLYETLRIAPPEKK
jgi:hypothetical protein